MDHPFANLPQAEVPRPRDSALGILLRRPTSGGREVLFARRQRRSRFMAGHLAFPGGGLEPADRPEREGGWARCASRELEEETGLRVDPAAWIDVGERITPPMFRVRFRTRFFLAECPAGAKLPAEPPAPREIDLLRFAAPAVVLDEWARGEALVPPPVLPVLRVLAAHPDLTVERLAGLLRDSSEHEQRLPRIEFVPDVWVLPVRTRTIPPATHTNVWMPGGRRFVVIDPGSDVPQEIERLLGVIGRRREETGGTPEAVLLTHRHPDHVSGAAAIAGALGVPVRAHRSVLEALDLPAGPALDEGDGVDLDGMTLRALHTPGHASGHLAFEIAERKTLFAGDLVSGLSTILIHPPEGHMETYLATLERVRAAGYRRLFPAHGPPLPPKAVEQVIAHRLEREAQVRDALGDGWRPLAAIARDAYRDVPGMPAVLIEGQALAHLERLESRGEARRREGAAEWSRAEA